MKRTFAVLSVEQRHVNDGGLLPFPLKHITVLGPVYVLCDVVVDLWERLLHLSCVVSAQSQSLGSVYSSALMEQLCTGLQSVAPALNERQVPFTPMINLESLREGNHADACTAGSLLNTESSYIGLVQCS